MRRLFLSFVVAGVLAAVTAFQQREQSVTHPVLERALKAKDKAPPVAILIEMGLKDSRPTDWSGTAVLAGGRIVGREGYRFRKDTSPADTLVEPNGWQASTHYSIRAPKNDPVVRRMEPVATVGMVVLVEGVNADATLTIQVKDNSLPPATVKVASVLAGTAVSLWNGAAVVRLVSTAQPVALTQTEDDFPAAAYGPDGTLWIAHVSYTPRDKSRSIEQHSLKEQPKDFKALYHPEPADRVWLRPYRQGHWGEPMLITDASGDDIARCAVAVTDKNRVWVIYSAQRNGNFAIFAQSRIRGSEQVASIRGKEVQVSTAGGPALSPVACVDSQGAVWVAYQAWTAAGQARIAVTKCVDGQWSRPTLDSSPEATGNCWHPALAAGPNGQVALAYDTYRDGSYDVEVVTLNPPAQGKAKKVYTIAGSSHFEARPSLVFDPAGKLWITYEYGPSRWGQNYGALDSKNGNPLYNTRTVQVKCLDGNNLLAPVASLPDLDTSAPQLPFDALKTHKFEKRTRLAYPQIGIDGKGRVWLTYRKNWGSRYSSHPGSIWRTYARRLDGPEWSPEIEVLHSDGLLDSRPALLPHHAGGLALVHNTDGRFTTPNTIHNQLYLSFLDGNRDSPKALFQKDKGESPARGEKEYARKEAEGVKAIRSYRVKAGGKTYQLLRGEFHRHTEISWDGGADGSLEDMFRYAIDAAGMDWIGNGDHDNGAGREYPWWLIQKFSDAYRVPGKFTPMFTYERSVAYPHGHRNCMFAQRGIMTLPRLAPPDDGKKYPGGVHPKDTRMLYRYLHEFGGICASHTSATGMGTDWRDNDPKVEPVVEIYQGDRMSYEYPEAPRFGYDPMSGKSPANVGGWKPLGFLDHALRDKGYRLGFQSSSDHWSTHISYFVVIAEKNDRQGILDAVKKRHSYAATDNIIVDLRSGAHLQGAEFTTTGAPALQFTVIGTHTIARIDVLKDSKVVKTFAPAARESRGQWTDPAPDNDTHYYYIRVQQTDEEIAWASPLWVRWVKG